MGNQVGQLIIHLLKIMKFPPNEAQILQQIADLVGLNKTILQKIVRDALHGGVLYGYIFSEGNKFYATIPSVEEAGSKSKTRTITTQAKKRKSKNKSKRKKDKGRKKKKSSRH